MRKGDLAMVVSFDTDSDLLAGPYRTIRAGLDRAINRTRINFARRAQGPTAQNHIPGTVFLRRRLPPLVMTGSPKERLGAQGPPGNTD